jgi:hypothetical protein
MCVDTLVQTSIHLTFVVIIDMQNLRGHMNVYEVPQGKSMNSFQSQGEFLDKKQIFVF